MQRLSIESEIARSRDLGDDSRDSAETLTWRGEPLGRIRVSVRESESQGLLGGKSAAPRFFAFTVD